MFILLISSWVQRDLGKKVIEICRSIVLGWITLVWKPSNEREGQVHSRRLWTFLSVKSQCSVRKEIIVRNGRALEKCLLFVIISCVFVQLCIIIKGKVSALRKFKPSAFFPAWLLLETLNWLLWHLLPGTSVYGLTFIISSPIFSLATCWSSGDHLDDPGRLQPKTALYLVDSQRLGENTDNVIGQNCCFPCFGGNAVGCMISMKRKHCMLSHYLRVSCCCLQNRGFSVSAVVHNTSCESHDVGSISFLRVLRITVFR